MCLTVEFNISPKNLVTGGILYLANIISVDFVFKTRKSRSKFRVKTIEQLTHYMKETKKPILSLKPNLLSLRKDVIRVTIPNFPVYLLLDFPCLTENIKREIKEFTENRKETIYKEYYHGRK